MKKILSVIGILAVAISVYSNALLQEAQAQSNQDVVFAEPVEQPSVPAVRKRFAQVNFDDLTIQLYYVVPSLESGIINNKVIVTGETLSNTPAWFARWTNFSAECDNALKAAAATNGLELK